MSEKHSQKTNGNVNYYSKQVKMYQENYIRHKEEPKTKFEKLRSEVKDSREKNL